MQSYGSGSIADFLGDFIVYRNLDPADPRVPGLHAVQAASDQAPIPPPRKIDPDYARVVARQLSVAHQLAIARQLDAQKAELRQVVFVGDSRLTDVAAFENLCAVAGWKGLAVICAETGKPFAHEVEQLAPDRWLLSSNRWTILNEDAAQNPTGEPFSDLCRRYGFEAGEATAMLVDIDKTAIGARGRNAHVIDRARQRAALDIAHSSIANGFDPAAFQLTYSALSQPSYHPLTEDNQDYLAYTCLVLTAGLTSFDELARRCMQPADGRFTTFIHAMDAFNSRMPPSLAVIHAGVLENVSRGDPTPFKPFRRLEYTNTIGVMGCLEDGFSIDEMLESEIVVTREVRQAALEWKAQGTLLFGLSDKPDEASLPTPELAEQGWLPLHHQPTHIVGA